MFVERVCIPLFSFLYTCGQERDWTHEFRDLYLDGCPNTFGIYGMLKINCSMVSIKSIFDSNKFIPGHTNKSCL